MQKINRNFPCLKHQSFTVLGSHRKNIITFISAFTVTVRLKTSIKEIKKLYKIEGFGDFGDLGIWDRRKLRTAIVWVLTLG